MNSKDEYVNNSTRGIVYIYIYIYMQTILARYVHLKSDFISRTAEPSNDACASTSNIIQLLTKNEIILTAFKATSNSLHVI